MVGVALTMAGKPIIVNGVTILAKPELLLVP
jgi:hypothetical protein